MYERFSSLVILGEPTLSSVKVSCHVHYKPRFRFRLTCSAHKTIQPLEQSFLLIKQWNFMAHFLNNIFELVVSCWSGKTESWLFCLVKCFEFYIFLIGFVDLLLTKIKLYFNHFGFGNCCNLEANCMSLKNVFAVHLTTRILTWQKWNKQRKWHL